MVLAEDMLRPCYVILGKVSLASHRREPYSTGSVALHHAELTRSGAHAGATGGDELWGVGKLVALKVLSTPSNRPGLTRSGARRWCSRRMCWGARARWWLSRCCAGSTRMRGRRCGPHPRLPALQELVSKLACTHGRQGKPLTLCAVPLAFFTRVASVHVSARQPAYSAVLLWLSAEPRTLEYKSLTLLLPQEARALRFAPAAARAVALRGAFCHGGHVCLVLQRLYPSLLDYVVDSAALAPAARLAHLRALALQLLVRARDGF